ncbi:MAG TPA: phosphonate metabolism protein/1,5-bisphosphokinase (PRPP-forming) PhnN [Acetobacteraceae bacterium]|jgi:phosphonate metabolism protein PhnN/1,5-bisphosphokinase (PRPP-forming)
MLVLVVGPSGAGKDTLLNAARQALADDTRYRFVRRVITRPAEAGGEDHEPVSDAEFATRALALSWEAHGLRYGIPADVADDVARGVVVVANVSRSVIAEAATVFPVRVIEVTAPAEVLAARLAARGRETAADVAARLARRVALPEGIELATVLNDASPEIGARRFLTHLTRILEETMQPSDVGERRGAPDERA